MLGGEVGVGDGGRVKSADGPKGKRASSFFSFF